MGSRVVTPSNPSVRELVVVPGSSAALAPDSNFLLIRPQEQWLE